MVFLVKPIDKLNMAAQDPGHVHVKVTCIVSGHNIHDSQYSVIYIHHQHVIRQYTVHSKGHVHVYTAHQDSGHVHGQSEHSIPHQSIKRLQVNIIRGRKHWTLDGILYMVWILVALEDRVDIGSVLGVLYQQPGGLLSTADYTKCYKALCILPGVSTDRSHLDK